MSDDKIDDLLAFGSAFNWITPALDLVAGYNSIEFEGDEKTCKRKENEYKAAGIRCRSDFVPESYTWRLLVKR